MRLGWNPASLSAARMRSMCSGPLVSTVTRETPRWCSGRMLELVVIKLNDVGALLGKQGGHLDELARSIRQLDLEVHDAAAGDHTFLNHRTHGHGVDIAAGHNRNHHVRAGGGGELARTQVQVFQRSQRNGAGPPRPTQLMLSRA